MIDTWWKLVLFLVAFVVSWQGTATLLQRRRNRG